MADREVIVHFIGDDRDLQRAFKNSAKGATVMESRITGIGKNLKTAFGAAGVAVGASALTAKLLDTTEAASDLNEQISRTEVILGDSAKATIDWSRTTASSMGISQRAALAATATFAGLFQTVGVNQREAGKLSQSLVKLAADLASLQNSTPEEALIALRSGLAGEAEPLRRFNIFLTEARVQQEAMAESGKKNASALTAQEKTLARYNLILQDSVPAQGNFALTSHDLANEQRKARAEADDLATTLGQALIPAMELATIAEIGLVGGLNNLIGGMGNLRKELRKTDAFDGWNEEVDSAFRSIGGFFDRIRDGIPVLGDLRNAITGSFGSTGNTPEGRGPGSFQGGPDAVDRLKESQKRQAQLLRDAEKSVKQNQDAFDAFAKGMGLKLDKARLTDDLGDDLAALRELESAILRRINAEGKTFKLTEQLTRVRLQIAETAERQAERSRQASEDAFDATIDALTLNLDIAAATKRLDDDQAALRALERAILARIKSEGQTTDLLRQLFEVRQKQAEAARALAQQKQFKALGLTETGEERGPSVKNLRQRAARLEDQIQGTVLDTAKTRAQLDRIAKVLSGKFGKVGKDVRAAILDMLNQISSAFKEGGKKVTKETSGTGTFGEITRGGIRSTDMLLRGLNLTPEQEDAIRKRNLGVSGRRGLSAFGFGIDNQPSISGGSTAGIGGAAGDTAIELRVFLDGKELETVITTRQQKKGRRTSASRRGRAGANKLGVG